MLLIITPYKVTAYPQRIRRPLLLPLSTRIYRPISLSQPTSQPTRQPTSQPTSQPISQPTLAPPPSSFLFALLSHSLWSLVACPTLPAAYTACYLLPCCLLLAPAVCCLPLSLCLLPTTTCLLPCCLLLLSLLRLLRAWLHLLYHPRIRVLRPPIEHLLYHPRVRVLRPRIEHPLSMPTRLPAWPGGAGGTLSGIPLGG